MHLKKSVLGLLMGILSVSILTGCQEQGNANEPEIIQGTKVNTDNLWELTGEWVTGFSYDEGEGQILAIKGPAANRDFVFLGRRMVYAHGEVFRGGDEYRPSRNSQEEEGPTEELYRMPVEEGKIKARYGIENSLNTGKHDRNLTVCGGYVLFERARDGMLGLCDGTKAYQGSVPWKEEYNGMVGTPKGELLMVRQLDTVCIARLEGTDISEPQEIVAHASERLQQPNAVLHPVCLDGNDIFVSIDVDGKAAEALGLFHRDGELIRVYQGADMETSDWAVTADYVLQAGRGGLAIYSRFTGEQLFLGEIQEDVHPVLLYALEDGRVLFYGRCQGDTFGIMELGPIDR